MALRGLRSRGRWFLVNDASHRLQVASMLLMSLVPTIDEDLKIQVLATLPAAPGHLEHLNIYFLSRLLPPAKVFST